jgi:hypothetical protein
MTSSTLSEENSGAAPVCARCGSVLASRSVRPYPTILHAVFGASFVLFLFFFEQVSQRSRPALWAWCAAQAALGLLLARARLQAKKRILRCIRCREDLV